MEGYTDNYYYFKQTTSAIGGIHETGLGLQIDIEGSSLVIVIVIVAIAMIIFVCCLRGWEIEKC